MILVTNREAPAGVDEATLTGATLAFRGYIFVPQSGRHLIANVTCLGSTVYLQTVYKSGVAIPLLESPDHISTEGLG